jgi:hypothetical protein
LIGSFHSIPTFIIVMNLVSRRCGANLPVDILWQAAISAHYNLEQGHISAEFYERLCDRLKVIKQF